MNKDRIAGSAKEIEGSIKETIGKATGDAKLEADGKADKVEGKIQTLSAVSRTRAEEIRTAAWLVDRDRLTDRRADVGIRQIKISATS
jgi:uncharacterized protein YjbJ (UPF0337 family)